MCDRPGQTHNRANLPVTLRNGREYVQASQMIARACALAGPDAYAANASFRRITAKRVLAAQDDCDGLSFGSIAIVASDGPSRIYFLREDEAEAPGDSVQPGWSLSKLNQTGPLDASYAFSGAASLEDRLEVSVNTLRGLHEELASDVRDVWFSGLREATIRTCSDPSGILETREIRRLKAGGRQLTMAHVRLSGSHGEQSGVFTFAYRLAQEGV